MDGIVKREDLLLIPLSYWSSLPKGFIRDSVIKKSLQEYYNATCTLAVVLGGLILILFCMNRHHPVIKTRVYRFMVIDVIILVVLSVTVGSVSATNGWRHMFFSRPCWILHSTMEALFCCLVMSTVTRTVMLYRTIQTHTPMKRLPYIDAVVDIIVDFFGFIFVGEEYRRLKLRLRLMQNDRLAQGPSSSEESRNTEKSYHPTKLVTGPISNGSDDRTTCPSETVLDPSRFAAGGASQTSHLSTPWYTALFRDSDVVSAAWCLFRYLVIWGAGFGICTANTRRLVGDFDRLPVSQIGPFLGSWADMAASCIIIGLTPLMLVTFRTALFARWDSLGMVFELIWIRGALNIIDICAAIVFLQGDLSNSNDAYTLLAVVILLEFLSTTLWPTMVLFHAYYQEYRFRRMAKTTQLKSEEAMEEFYHSPMGRDMVRDVTAKNYAVENFVFLELTQKPLSNKHFGDVYRDMISEHGPWQINITSTLYERWGSALNDPQKQLAVIRETRRAVFSLLITNYRHVFIREVQNMS
ncbi:hypothetical protein CXG81DRAFT_28187 [Caulochytrium protostelioides]|uniref:RGS domain-containing protein n=1 Tax=Caulochytrium protostelioides TaxID=1555241 RepID=A0A4P9X1Y2_9FUNG|nr:hypothetical protein CXG81DRAFT_28187 [Caulochytrium protostelioides]|eukprot:RKO99023.1 hypothetical protein CXG81DRAFT_28187 [Caulochytrium protostelioides]